MAWKHYRLVFRLQSPLHIGYRKVGNLMQTRRYVPGKNLWAALTERLVHLAEQGHRAVAYREVGTILKAHFRFGYLWPARATEKDKQENRCPSTRPHFPWDESDLAYWDYLYLDGTARTAQIAEARTAAEGSLHEVEFIAPYTRKGAPVYLMGDLWVKEEYLPRDVSNVPVRDAWKQALQVLRVGGERGYGWGRVERCLLEPTTSKATVAGFSWGEQGNEVVVGISEGLPILAHALATGDNALSNIQGMVEPLVGWEQQPDGRYKVSQPIIVYTPESTVTREMQVRINVFGIYEASDSV